MPPGWSDTSPATSCHDARGREVDVFNPIIRAGEVPDGWNSAEWRSVRAGLHRSLPSRLWPFVIATTAFALIGFTISVGDWLVSGFQRFEVGGPLILAAFPAVACVAFALFMGPIRWLLSFASGLYAFDEPRPDRIVAALLSARRCGSCSYPLTATEDEPLAICPECGSAWLLGDKESE